VIGLSSSSVPRDLLPDIQTEEDLQAIFEANSVSIDRINRRKITPRKCPLTRIYERRCHGDTSFIQ
jgi:hypothetical protein